MNGAGTALLALTASCAAPHSALAPGSDAAEDIAGLWWLLLGVCLAVYVVVLALFAFALWRRRDHAAGPEPTGGMRKLIVIGGAVVPAVILLGLTAATIRTSSRLHPAEQERGPIEVQVVGHQFWWEVRYPGTGVLTANEIHLPVGRPARLTLVSGDVIHSLWVPRLHGKKDLTPGRQTELVLVPREPGVYRGFCTEFCGVQHALMGLLVIAQPAEEFEAWLAGQARPAASAADSLRAAGERVFVERRCHLCHRVRGLDAGGPPADVGPDLTHLADRRTLAAGTVRNSRANLTAWILDPDAAKPGVRMPATRLNREELDALVAYLEGLR